MVAQGRSRSGDQALRLRVQHAAQTYAPVVDLWRWCARTVAAQSEMMDARGALAVAMRVFLHDS